jgi:hypothetical protein
LKASGNVLKIEPVIVICDESFSSEDLLSLKDEGFKILSFKSYIPVLEALQQLDHGYLHTFLIHEKLEEVDGISGIEILESLGFKFRKYIFVSHESTPDYRYYQLMKNVGKTIFVQRRLSKQKIIELILK